MTSPRQVRVLVLTAVLVMGCTSRPPLAPLAPPEPATRLADDADAVLVYRAGLRSVVAFADARPDLVPAAKVAGPRLLGRAEREAVRDVWVRFLDYVLALDSVGKAYQAFDRLDALARDPAFLIAHATFVAAYRFSLELLDRLERDPGLDPLLDEAVPELGLPAGTYAQLKRRVLSALRATEFVALGVLAGPSAGGATPELDAAIAEDRERIWEAGRGRGPVLTATNALRVVQQTTFAAWFPVQAGVSSWMAHRQLGRPDRPLVSAAQLEAVTPRLRPGDILLVRRHWYLSDIGLPGFWPHAALYIGTPEERRLFFTDPGVQAWVRGQGQATGDFELLLAARYPEAYPRSLTQAEGRPRRVLEAVSAGVIFSSLDQLAADSMAVLRPRLAASEKAAAIGRAFQYAGRPYDFDFDFRTDAAIVCTELVYKAYEPAPGFGGLRLAVPVLLCRPVMPANELARQFDAAFGSPDQPLDLVLFLDGQERAGTAVERPVAAFRESWQRPKWQFLVPE